MKKNKLTYIFLFSLNLCFGQEQVQILMNSILKMDSITFPEATYFTDAFVNSNEQFVIDTVISELHYYKIKDKLFNYTQFFLIETNKVFFYVKQNMIGLRPHLNYSI